MNNFQGSISAFNKSSISAGSCSFDFPLSSLISNIVKFTCLVCSLTRSLIFQYQQKNSLSIKNTTNATNKTITRIKRLVAFASLDINILFFAVNKSLQFNANQFKVHGNVAQ
jgi:hypothetical protein